MKATVTGIYCYDAINSDWQVTALADNGFYYTWEIEGFILLDGEFIYREGDKLKSMPRRAKKQIV